MHALKIVGKILLCIVAVAAILLAVLTVAEYRPLETEAVTVSGGGGKTLNAGDEITLMTWNIGYGALGSNADFFMDGGSMVMTADENRVRANLEELIGAAKETGADILLLQEVDLASTRSHGINETALWREAFPDMASAFAYNYNALFVPYPWPPIGHVESGLMTLSAFAPAQAERVSLPCPFSWPVRTVNLKRGLLVERFPAAEGKELVLINLHLEAYDNGEGKAAQTEKLLSLMRAEIEKGNYVIAGGDFNQVFSSVDMSAFPVYEGNWQPGQIESGVFEPDLHVTQDASKPTCRSLKTPLDGADLTNFQFYLIDGFIVSDNVNVVSVETLDKGFSASDHNPMVLKVTLN